MKISKASTSDLPEILALQKLAYQENRVRYDDPNIPPLVQTLDNLISEIERKVFLKAEIDGVIIGSVRGELRDDHVFIEKLIVHPDEQNKGIGKTLMNAIELEFDVNEFRLFTGHLDFKNIALYEKLGYAIYGETERVSESLSFVKMRKFEGCATCRF